MNLKKEIAVILSIFMLEEVSRSQNNEKNIVIFFALAWIVFAQFNKT